MNIIRRKSFNVEETMGKISTPVFLFFLLHIHNLVHSQNLGPGDECDFNEQCVGDGGKPGICDARYNQCCKQVIYEMARCVPTKSIGDSCVDDIECRNIPALCMDGFCTCNPESSLQSTRQEKKICTCMDGFLRATKLADCRVMDYILREKCDKGQENKQETEVDSNACVLYHHFCNRAFDISNRPGFCRIGCRSTDPYGDEWEAARGKLAWKACPFGSYSQVGRWYCQENGVFNGTIPDYSECESDWVKALLKNIANVEKIDLKVALNLTEQIIGNVSLALAAPLPGGGSDLYGHELGSLLSVLDQLADKFIPVRDGSQNMKLCASILKTVDILLQYETPWIGLDEEHLKPETFSKVLHTMPNVIMKVAERGCYDQNSTFKSTCKFPLLLEIGEMGHLESKQGNYSQEISKSSKNKGIRGQSTRFRIMLSQKEDQLWVGSFLSSEYTRKYSSQRLVIPGGYDVKFQTNSDLASFSSVKLRKGNSGPIRDDSPMILEEPIELTLWHSQYSWGSGVGTIQRALHPGELPTAVKSSVHCVFWNATAGAWSSEGCEVQVSSSFSTSCVCNHLSSFTVMMRIHKYIGNSKPLRAITITLVILFMIYFLLKILLIKKQSSATNDDVPEEGSNSVKNMALILTLFCYGIIFFLVDKQYFFFHDLTCYRIGMLGHFMTLASFLVLTIEFLLGTIDYTCWKQLEFLLIYGRTKPVTIFLGIPVGLSFLVVLGTVGIDHYDGLDTRAYGGEFCWLDEPFVKALFIPLWTLVSLNFVLLFLVVRKALGRMRERLGTLPTLGGRDVKVAQVIFYVKSGVVTNCLVLSTWLIAYFHLGPHYVGSKILPYLFPILFALQGILMERVIDKEALVEPLKQKVVGWLVRFFVSGTPGDSCNVHKEQQAACKKIADEAKQMMLLKKKESEFGLGEKKATKQDQERRNLT